MTTTPIPNFTSWDFNNRRAVVNSLVTQINAIAGTSIAQFTYGDWFDNLNSLITQVNTLTSRAIPKRIAYDEGSWLHVVNGYIKQLNATGAPF